MDLLQILEVTESINTKLSIIASLGPRVTDPKAKASKILNIFRYSEQKEKVTDGHSSPVLFDSLIILYYRWKRF
jgi:hypothetical protein